MSEGKALVPKLRFREFRGADEWQQKLLGNAGEFLSSLSGKSGSDFDRGDAKFITYMNVFSNTFTDPNDLRSVDVAQGERQNAVASGDIFFTISSETAEEVGMSSVLLQDIANCYLNSFCALFRFFDGKAPNPIFAGYLLRQPSVRAYFSVKAQGSTRFNLSKDAFKRLPLFIPPAPEQQKLADCLSSLDELIAAQARKVDALKSHKKGLVQQLFPHDGETQPRLRLADSEEGGNWVRGDLGSNTNKIGSGITPAGGDTNYKQSGRPFVRSQNVGWGELLLKDVAFIDEKVHSSFSATEIKTLDVLLNITGASIGRCAVADERIMGGNVNQHVCIIRVKPAQLSPFFISQYLISAIGQGQIDSFQAGGNRQGLNFAQIRSFLIPLPPTISEQQRIADCLTSLDKLIATATQELATFETHKNGLMQQLFPSAEAVEA